MSDTKTGAQKRRFLMKAALVAVFLTVATGLVLWLDTRSRQTAFPMKEVPTPQDLQAPVNLMSCVSTPRPEVKLYPQFHTAPAKPRPLGRGGKGPCKPVDDRMSATRLDSRLRYGGMPVWPSPAVVPDTT